MELIHDIYACIECPYITIERSLKKYHFYCKKSQQYLSEVTENSVVFNSVADKCPLRKLR